MELHGAVVVVTGASSGIGAAAARAFGAKGATVALLARSPAGLGKQVDLIRDAGGRAHAYPIDIADIDAVEATTRTIVTDLGGIDVLVNNAGSGRWTAIDETDPHDAVQMMMVPYLGAFAMTHYVLQPMLERGAGVIVNVTSPAGYVPMPGAASYSVARAAMRALAESTRADLSGTGVRCGLVTAGEVESDYWRNNPGSRDRVPTISTVLGTLSPQEAAQAIVRCAERDGADVVVPRRLAALLLIYRIAPGPIRALVGATGWRRPAATAAS
jgi:short-subunit dehydrogenase